MRTFFLILFALLISSAASAEGPWNVTLGVVDSGGCSEGFYRHETEAQWSLDLSDPLAPRLTIESLNMYESGSFVEERSFHHGPTWTRNKFAFQGTLSSHDLDKKTWTFALQSAQTWSLKGSPSPIAPPLPPPDSTQTFSDTIPDLTLTCAHASLTLTTGVEAITLQCDVSDIKHNIDLRGFRVYEAGSTREHRIYLRQDGPLTGLNITHKNVSTWQETPIHDQVWGN